MRRRRLRYLLPWILVAACATDPIDPGPDGPGAIPPNLGDRPIRPGDLPAQGGRVPEMEGGPMFFSGGGFTFTGATAPGSATFEDAPVWDWESPDMPPPGGAGEWVVTLDGVTFAGHADEAMALVYEDRETGVDYLVLGEYRIYPDATTGVDLAEVVYVVTPAADFAPGASVTLDGVDRVALFMTGPADAEQPELVAAAVTGTVTFDAGGLLTGDLVTASVSGDFGVVEWEVDPVDPPADPLAEGSYALAIVSPGEVYCDGTLAGSEADFAFTAADLGFADGAVDMAVASEGMLLTGAPISSGFAPELLLTPDGAGLWIGFADRSAAGPIGTTLLGTFFLLDGATVTPTGVAGWLGALWEDPPRTGMCQIGYEITMTGP